MPIIKIARTTFAMVVAVVITSAIALAAATKCPEHFAGGEAPDLINAKLKVMASEVCYSGYAVMHSGVTRTPIYTAEYLTRERLLQAKTVKRHNRFHADENIPVSERAELSHYVKSGYDRGHMAPSADMTDAQSQYESFSLANMVPQVPANNRGAWAKIEAEVRELVMKRGKLYVITGPIYDESDPQTVGGTVSVPAKLFKAVFDPEKQEEVYAYLIDNAANDEPQEITISSLEKSMGVIFFLYRLQ